MIESRDYGRYQEFFEPTKGYIGITELQTVIQRGLNVEQYN